MTTQSTPEKSLVLPICFALPPRLDVVGAGVIVRNKRKDEVLLVEGQGLGRRDPWVSTEFAWLDREVVGRDDWAQKLHLAISENEGVTDEALELTWQLSYVVPCFV